MRSINTSSNEPANGRSRAHDLEMSAAALSIGGDMMMSLPVYEQYRNGRGRAGSEVTLVEVERTEENEEQGVLTLPPPAYHVNAGSEHEHEVDDIGKQMNAERCAS